MAMHTGTVGRRRRAPIRVFRQLIWGGLVLGLIAAGAGYGLHLLPTKEEPQSRAVPQAAAPAISNGEIEVTDLQRRGLTVEPVMTARFQPIRKTEGKIAVDENKTTPVFSQYSSAHVIRTYANTGDFVEKGAPLLQIETPDMVQAG